MTEEAIPKDNVVVPASGGSKFLRLPFKFRMSKKTIMILVVAVITLVIAVGLILYEQKPKTPKISTFDLAYNTAVTIGNYSQGQQILDNAIKKSTNNQNTVNLYLQKATVAINAKHPDDAMQFAQKADSITPSSTTASMIADVAAAQGNKTLAIQWLNTTIQRLDKNSQGYRMDLEDIQQKIKDLSQ